MAGEKLTQIKIRKQNQIIETIPISISVENIQYDENFSLKEKIDNLNLDNKLNKNLGRVYFGQFLTIDENGEIIPSVLNTENIRQSLNIPIKLGDLNNDQGYITEIALSEEYKLEKETINQFINNFNDLKINSQLALDDLNNNIIDPINKKLLDIQAFMIDPKTYIDNHKNTPSQSLTNVAKKIVQIEQSIDSLNQKQNELVSISDQHSNQISAIQTNLSNFQEKIQFQNDKQNGVIVGTEPSKIQFGISGQSAPLNLTSMLFFGNDINKVGMQVNSQEQGGWRLVGRMHDNEMPGISLYHVRNSKWEYNTEIFIQGQQITVQNGVLYSGVITNDLTKIKFFIPLKKSCRTRKIVAQWAKTSNQLRIRTAQGGYVNDSEYFDIGNKNITYTGTTTGIIIDIENKNKTTFQNIENNSLLNVHFLSDVTFIFN